MTVKPEEIYKNVQNNSMSKYYALDLLLYLIETLQDEELRKDCLEIIEKIEINNDKLFSVLENLLISDPNIIIRFRSLKLIAKRFLHKGIPALSWALQYEKSLKNLVTILNSLKNIENPPVRDVLIKELKKITNRKFKKELDNVIKDNVLESYTNSVIANILINHAIISSLNEKFKNLEYTVENGLITELDFSKIDFKIINWRDREAIQDFTEIYLLDNLMNIKSIKLFPLKWAIDHEFALEWLIKLVIKIKDLNKECVRQCFITEIKNISNTDFSDSIKKASGGSIEAFNITKLSSILISYYTASYLKKKHPEMNFELTTGIVTKLRLKEKKIVTLPNCIRYLIFLKELTIQDCSLYRIPGFIGRFRDLVILNLENNNIELIPRSINTLNSLKYLNLSYNILKKLPYTLGGLKSLKELILDRNLLKRIPNSIGSLLTLRTLNLNQNRIRKIPVSIRNLTLLSILKLNRNSIEKLPDIFNFLHSLRILEVNFNQLEELPISIGSAYTLKELKLEENELKRLPISIRELKSLEVLELAMNQLEEFPTEINTLTNLKKVDLFGNKYQIFEEEISTSSKK